MKELFVTLEGKKDRGRMAPHPSETCHCTAQNSADTRHRRITPLDSVEGVRCPLPADPTCLSFCKERTSPAISCVSTAQQTCCAAGLRSSREELSCQGGQYFHIVSARSMGVLGRQESHPSEERKGKRRGGGEVIKCLEEQKSGFQDRSTRSNPPKTISEFCWVSTFRRRCNRLR